MSADDLAATGVVDPHTTMHHDHANSMSCNVLGRKRFRLAPPASLAMLDHARGMDSHWDPRDEAPAGLVEVVLVPGEAPFLPTGWWHQVDALELAISVSIRAFAWPTLAASTPFSAARKPLRRP